MRFLHTSDWHLGKGLKGHNLSVAQQDALDFMIDTAIDRKVGAFIIAGDVFDRAFPAVDDVRRLRRALTRLHGAGIPVICIAGNHDEGARLAAYSDLLAHDITMVGEYEQIGTSVVLTDEYGPVVFYPLPYLEPDSARRILVEPGAELLQRSHEAVLKAAMERIRVDFAQRKTADASARAVVVAHAFIVKGNEAPEELQQKQSDSERDIACGGVPSAPTAVFDGVHYVALGHLHGPRTVQNSEPMVRYSGSILRYSLSEMSHEKSVTIVDIDASGACTLEVVAVPQPAGMVRLRGSIEEFESGRYDEHRGDFVEITLTDQLIPDNHFARLTQVFERILSVAFARPDDKAVGLDFVDSVGLEQIPPQKILRSFYQHQQGSEITDSMARILQEVLEEAHRKLSDVSSETGS